MNKLGILLVLSGAVFAQTNIRAGRINACSYDGRLVAGSQCYSTIQAAINAAASTGQDVLIPTGTAFDSAGLSITNGHPTHLVFQPGTYTYSGTNDAITCTGQAGVVMEGSGHGITEDAGTVIFATVGTVNGIRATNCNGIQIKNLDLQGPATGTGYGIRISSTRFLVQSTHVTAFGSHGIWIDGATANSNIGILFNVRADHNGGYGFYAPSTNGQVTSYIGTDGSTNTLENYFIANSGNTFVSANSDHSVAGIGYHFASGAVMNSGSIYSDSPTEAVGAQFDSGANSNTFTPLSSTMPINFLAGASNNYLLAPTVNVTDSGSGNRYQVTPSVWSSLNSTSISLGRTGVSAGTATFTNATSGSIVLSPPSGALGSSVAFLPIGTYTLAGGQDCGSTTGGTQACANTAKASFFVVRGDVLLNTATSQSITSLPFNGATSYSCTGSDLTTLAGVINFDTYAAASVTIHETGGTNADHLRWSCIGF